METAVVSAIVSSLHLLALAIGLPAVFVRGRALRGPLDAAAFGRLFAADSVWGIAALLWISTGLLRVFAGLEKGTAFYMVSPLFWAKMSLLALVIVLEIWPAITFVRWRRLRAAGADVDRSAVPGLRRINHLQLVLVVGMLVLASLMARGVGLR